MERDRPDRASLPKSNNPKLNVQTEDETDIDLLQFSIVARRRLSFPVVIETHVYIRKLSNRYYTIDKMLTIITRP